MIKDYHRISTLYDKAWQTYFQVWKHDTNDTAMVIITPQHITHYFSTVKDAFKWIDNVRKL